MKKNPFTQSFLWSTALCSFVLVVFPGITGAGVFTVPYGAIVYLTPMGGEAGGSTEFGVGASPSNAIPIFTGLPSAPVPAGEMKLGTFAAGTELDFYQKTTFDSPEWAFSADTESDGALCAFLDLDNSLGLGGDIAEKTGPATWLLHLDDASSYRFDDDGNDILIQIRLESDADVDGVADELDQCPDTPAGVVVNEYGCSIVQLAPCEGPVSGGTWENHGQFVSTFTKVAKAFLVAGLITEAEKEAMVRAAAQSDCGR